MDRIAQIFGGFCRVCPVFVDKPELGMLTNQFRDECLRLICVSIDYFDPNYYIQITCVSEMRKR